ncbi:MAG TPA: hypothetical protein VGW34_10020 [Allosphingosinicella sp.]|nr:hypothetical protein [Allosphingosinicella sp.]
MSAGRSNIPASDRFREHDDYYYADLSDGEDFCRDLSDTVKAVDSLVRRKGFDPSKTRWSCAQVRGYWHIYAGLGR